MDGRLPRGLAPAREGVRRRARGARRSLEPRAEGVEVDVRQGRRGREGLAEVLAQAGPSI